MSNWVDGIHMGLLTAGRFSIEGQWADTSSDVNVSHIYGYIIGPLGAPSSGATVRFNVSSPPVFYDGTSSTLAVTMALTDTTTNEDGYFEVDLIKGTSYRMYVDDIGLFMAFTVPATPDVIDIFELLSP